jgi:hypothetical protein
MGAIWWRATGKSESIGNCGICDASTAAARGQMARFKTGGGGTCLAAVCRRGVRAPDDIMTVTRFNGFSCNMNSWQSPCAF